MIIAFDVDGTLIDYEDNARWEVVELAKMLAFLPNTRVIIWSGGGQPYAEMWARRLGFTVSTAPTMGSEVECFAKFDPLAPVMDVAFDDDLTVQKVRKLFVLYQPKPLPILGEKR